MFDHLVDWLAAYPYLAVALVFLICGVGLPLPEEITLIAAGYVCATVPDKAELPLMMAVCGGSILMGDLIPFLLGRVFGIRLLRLRWMRFLITKRRLATFDVWFRRRGDLVIFIARFLAGIRVVAFFTAGTMKMPLRRFLAFDFIGIAMIVPLLTWIGYRFHEVIDGAIARVQSVERGILWTILGLLAFGLVWYWRRRRAQGTPAAGETFVEPRMPVQGQAQVDPDRPAVVVDLPELDDPLREPDHEPPEPTRNQRD